MTLDGKQGEYAYQIILQHIGHDIGAYSYGGIPAWNTVIECNDCNTVLFDADAPITDIANAEGKH